MIDYSEQFDKERKYRVEVSHHKYGSARKVGTVGTPINMERD